LRLVNLPTEDEEAASRPLRSWLTWGLVAAVIIAGVVLALLYGPRITPVLDTLT
jgi:hypothetical protein